MVQLGSSGWSNPAAQMNLDIELDKKEHPVTVVFGFIYEENIGQKR